MSAQDYFWFDDGGVVSPAEGIVDQLDKIVIDYTHCAGTSDGLNIGTGKGQGWITSNAGNYNVTFSDDYNNHKLSITVVDGPIVKAGDYKLTIPEGAFNVYGNASLINDAVSYYYTVSGVNDVETPQLHIVSSYPTEGQALTLPVESLTLTFDQDVTVTHSVFDAAGRITNLTSGGFIQLNMKAEGNTVTLTKGSYSSSDFYAGQQYQLELYAGHIKAAADASVSLPETAISFSIASEDDTEGLKVMTQIPAAGENIHNAGSITFNMNISAVDKEKVSLVNENGHVAPLSTVGRDEQSQKSLIFNIASGTHLQGGTTYKLHLEAGAVTAGNYTNEEQDAAYWCIPREQFAFTADIASTTVPQFSQVSISAIDAGSVSLQGESSGIKVTGVSTNAGHVYAELAELSIETSGNDAVVTLSFDQTITPEVLAQGGAIYNSVKVVVPEGTFIDSEGRVNRQYEFIIYVIAEREMGEQTWTFKPASGSELDSLGTPWYGEDEEGNRQTYYNISFEVSGENVYARIPDGSKLYILETLSNTIAREFGRNDVIGYNNKFTLELGESAITDDGIYQLVIPAEAINLYSDSDCRTNPIHPDADVTATWTVGNPDLAIEAIAIDRDPSAAYDLLGRKTSGRHGFSITRGHVATFINR